MKYKWALGARMKSKAQPCGERIEALTLEHGKVTPLIVVEAARDQQSPLHGEFEWHDRRAAEAYRCDQARKILRSLVTVEISGVALDTPTRAFVCVTGHDEDGDATGLEYQCVSTVVRNSDELAEVVMRARKELSDWSKRYERFAALRSVAVRIARLAAGLGRRKKRRP